MSHRKSGTAVTKGSVVWRCTQYRRVEVNAVSSWKLLDLTLTKPGNRPNWTVPTQPTVYMTTRMETEPLCGE